MKIFRKTTVLLALLSLLLISACEIEKPAAKKTAQTPRVEVANPLVKEIEIWDEYQAQIEGEKSVEIRARVNGYLQKIHFNDGDFVKEGQLLFEIDSRPFEAIVEACKATVSEIQAKVDFAEGNLRRGQELMSSNAISKEMLETRKSELATAKAVLLSAQAKLKEENLNLEFTKIYSPISGYVSKRFVDEGNLVSASTTMLATIVSRDFVYAYFQVSERDLIRYAENKLFDQIDQVNKKGPAVQFSLMDETTPSHFGYLNYVENKLNSLSFELRAIIENKNGKLFPGMYGMIRLCAGKPQKRILLPEYVIGTDLVGRYVLCVDKENIVVSKPVKLGELIDNMQVVLEGITQEDFVIINGLQRATPKAKVDITVKEIEQ